MTTPDAGREIRYRMTAGDFADWSRLASGRASTAEPVSHRIWRGFDWVSYCFALGVWAALAALAAENILGPEWRNGVFLVAFVAVALATARRDVAAPAPGRSFEGTLHAAGETVIRIESEAIIGAIAGVTVTIPWAAVYDVRQGPTLALVSYDRSGAGLCIVRHAFPDEAAMEEFLSEIGRRCAAARSADGGETER